jgi:putative oxidoreductase
MVKSVRIVRVDWRSQTSATRGWFCRPKEMHAQSEDREKGEGFKTMSKLVSRVRLWHDQFFALVSYVQSPFLLFVRLYWGWQLAQSGWGKLHNLADVTDFFTSLNLPFPAQTAVAISSLELFGGIFLELGLLSRTTALVLAANMFMAYVTADREALFSIFSDPDKFSAAAPFTFLVASVIVLLFGPGKIALDTLLRSFTSAPDLQESRSISS